MNSRFFILTLCRKTEFVKCAFAIFCIFVLITSCDKKPTIDRFHYYQSFDELKGWFPSHQNITSLVLPHSGNYCYLTNESNPYSTSLSLKFKEIDLYKPKKIKSSVWCYVTDTATNAEFCLQIKTPTGEFKHWKTTPINKQVTKTNTWTKLDIVSEIEKSMYAADNEISIYFWNQGKSEIFVDDFEVEFYREI